MAQERPNINLTKLRILKTAMDLFLEKGYSAVTSMQICKTMDISPGTLTYHYAAKEDLLAVLIQMLADFQWKTVQNMVNDGETTITALCFELTAMAVMCEEDDIARDLYISAYTSPKSLEIIRSGDAKRAKKVFAEFCSDWTDEMYAEAELLVSGIEYATLYTTETSPPLEARIAGAMNQILSIYNVPKERRKMKIDKALKMDYRKFGSQVLSDFKQYVWNMTDSIVTEAENLRDLTLI